MACGRQTRDLDGSAVSQDRLFLLAGAISGFLGVGAGAFGAHALRARLTPELLSVFETAVRYQMYHALALIAAGWVASRWPGALAGASADKRNADGSEPG